MSRAARILEFVTKKYKGMPQHMMAKGAPPYKIPKPGEHGTTLRDVPKKIKFDMYKGPGGKDRTNA